MASIAKTSLGGSGSRAITKTTLGSSDTFSYSADENAVLVLDNSSGGALTVNIDGDGASTVQVPGVGSVSVAAGYSTGSIPDGASRAIPLNSIKEYLKGVIAVTGGTGIKAYILTK